MLLKPARTISLIIIIFFLTTSSVFSFDLPNRHITPQLRTVDPDFKELYVAMAVCRAVELVGIDDLPRLDRELGAIKSYCAGIDISTRPDEIYVEILNTDNRPVMAIRYYIKGKAPVIPSADDVARLTTKVIDEEKGLVRQIIYLGPLSAARKEQKMRPEPDKKRIRSAIRQTWLFFREAVSVDQIKYLSNIDFFTTIADGYTDGLVELATIMLTSPTIPPIVPLFIFR